MSGKLTVLIFRLAPVAGKRSVIINLVFLQVKYSPWSRGFVFG